MSISEKDLKKYAQVIVRIGANVQPGQKVLLNVGVDQIPLALAVTEECYKAGACRVEITWLGGDADRLHYSYADEKVLGTVLPWEEEKARQMTVDYPCRIFIESEDPDVLSGISAEKLSNVSRGRMSVLKKYRDAIDGKHQWLIVAAASPKWAKKVFPTDDEETAVSKLWDAIFSCMYFDEDSDPVDVWKKHTSDIESRAKWLNEQHFARLEYKSKNGTDFSVELIPEAHWGGAGDVNHLNNARYVPNMPTEEVYTSPMRGKCEGRLVATKPLSWSGQLIENFYVDFKDGKVCGCKAEKGQEILEKMFAMDEGASMLGEVALVPKESPINRSGLLFYNTLFDENACCHVAVGMGFDDVIEGFIDMTDEEIYALGVNDSIIHVDFMVGSEDLDITGYREDGTAVPVFRNGTWAN